MTKIDKQIADCCLPQKEFGEPLMRQTETTLGLGAINSFGEPQMYIEHHIKYKELDGIDETVWMSRSEHDKMHIRMRKQGASKIPKKITIAACNRTQKRKARNLHFIDTIAPHIRLREPIYYAVSGEILYSSYFNANHGKKLLEVDI